MASKKAVVLDGNPYMLDHSRTNAVQLFEKTGGNTGNLAFRFGVARSLESATYLPLGASAESVRRAGDIVVLPLANQLGPHTKLGTSAAHLRRIDLPVLALGLGAQADDMTRDVSLDAGTFDWLKEIVTRSPSDSPNIGARGSYTQTQISRLGFDGSAVVTGCPSNFIEDDPELYQKLKDGFSKAPKKIAVSAGIPYLASLSSIERCLADIVTLTGGAYIVQHGMEMIRLAMGEASELKPETLELCRRYILPHGSNEQLISWFSEYGWVFSDVRQWMSFVRRFDFVVGTRFHGAMLAIQAGVPAACIAHDSRTLELCNTMKIPVRHHTEIGTDLTRHNIFDFFSFDTEDYKETRRQLGRSYVDLLLSADLNPSKSLLKILA